MKQITIRSFPSRRDWHFGGFALALVLLIWFGLTPSAAQQNPRRVTSVRAVDAPAGSKVTVVSDSALNDYEAYRRGDRFYVKVPQAGLAATQPQLRGNGFDDVEVQKSGDALVFSFRLKPGTAARVSQRMNRLDVIFSTPAGSQNASVSSTPLPNTGSGRTRPVDVPAPVAPGTTRSSRDPRNASEGREGTPAAQTRTTDSNSRDPELPTEQPGSAGSTSSGEASPGGANSGLSSEAQTPAPQSKGASTPSSTPTSQTEAIRSGFSNLWLTLNRWVTLNWLLVLVGLLILLGLALIFVRRKASKSREAAKRWPRVTPVKARVGSDGALRKPALPNTVSRAVGKSTEEVAEPKTPPLIPIVPVIAELKRTDEDSASLTSSNDFQEFPANQVIPAVPLPTEQPSELNAGPATPSSVSSLDTNPSPADETLMEVVMDPVPPLASVKPAATPATVPENQEDHLSGTQGFELQAFSEFMESRVSEQATPKDVAKQTPPPTSPTLQAPPATSSKSVANDFAGEEARLLLQEQALRRAAEGLDARRLMAENAQKTAEANAQLQADLEAQAEAEAEGARISAAMEVGQHAELEARRRIEQETTRRLQEEEARLTFEAEVLINAGAEVVRRGEQENRFRLEAETLRRVADELARKRLAAAAARKAAEEESRVRSETEARRQAAEIARLRVEEEAQRELQEVARRHLEEESRLRAEEDALRLAAAEADRRAEAERQQCEAASARYAEDEKLRLEHEVLLEAAAELTRRRAEVEHARIRTAEETRLLLEHKEQIRVEEEQKGLALERKRFEAEAERRAAQERARIAEAHQRAVEEQKRVAELARLAAEEGERRLSELENVRRQAEERTRQLAEQEERIRAEIELLLQTEEAQRQRVEAETRLRAEAETRLIEEARRRAEAAQLHADQARLQAGEDARAQTEAEARRLAEVALVRVETEARRRAEQEAHAPVEKETEPGLRAEGVGLDAPLTSAETTMPWLARSTERANGLEDPQAKLVAQLSEDSSIPTDILRKFNSVEPSERSWALAELAQVGGDPAFHVINRAFDDHVPEVRRAAARALYDSQSDRAAAFTRALRGSSPERRKAIGEALATSGLANDAIGNLTGESRDKTYDAFSLLFLMAKAGAVQPLMNAIEEHESIEVRLAVVKLLVLSGQTEVLPAFRRLVVHGSLPSEVRSAVMEAIYQMEGVPVA